MALSEEPLRCFYHPQLSGRPAYRTVSVELLFSHAILTSFSVAVSSDGSCKVTTRSRCLKNHKKLPIRLCVCLWTVSSRSVSHGYKRSMKYVHFICFIFSHIAIFTTVSRTTSVGTCFKYYWCRTLLSQALEPRSNNTAVKPFSLRCNNIKSSMQTLSWQALNFRPGDTDLTFSLFHSNFGRV